MSADNGIYILATEGGYKVAHAQAIENLFIPDPVERDNIEETIFGKSEIYKTRGAALAQADRLLQEMNDAGMYVEYGIQFI